ncbi:MAG: hypothetical protein HOV87_01115 [Catenulispora sp.]|nr:hypothetical protein [Catenulispora sp.]
MLLGEHGNPHTATVPARPTGLGTSAAALAEAGRPARAVAGLYCPGAVRDDPALAAEVQQRLDTWATEVGAQPAAVARLGRLAMLTHPDTADPARLAVAGQLLALGAMVHSATLPSPAASVPVVELPAAGLANGADAASMSTLMPTLMPMSAPELGAAVDTALEEMFDACDLPGSAGRPATPGALTDHPVAVSALAGLSALPASPYQVDRVRREYQVLAASAPTRSGPHPPWEHLALGHLNAYSPVLAALDALDGYELPPPAAARPELRRVRQLAALAAALLHDVAAPSPTGLSAAIARADGLGAAAAVRRAAAVHDDAMRAFQQHATLLAGSTADLGIRRYLAGLWTWLGGHRSWHTDRP